MMNVRRAETMVIKEDQLLAHPMLPVFLFLIVEMGRADKLEIVERGIQKLAQDVYEQFKLKESEGATYKDFVLFCGALLTLMHKDLEDADALPEVNFTIDGEPPRVQ